MQNRFQLEWDVDALANAFGVSADDVQEYLTDGRRVSFMIERRLKRMHAGWELAKSEGAGYDLLDPQGGKWEVRSITGQGVYFNPSNQVGKGRKFDLIGFNAKLGGIEGFILADVVTFPIVDFYKFPVSNVIRWHAENKLGKNAKIGRNSFLKKLAPDISY